MRALLAIAVLCSMAALGAGCTVPPPEDQAELRPATRTVASIYRIDRFQRQAMPSRLLEAINVVRNKEGLNELKYSPELNAAAFTHALDMSVQRRPWHFGSDRSSPITRVKTTGFEGRLIGENIAESFDTPIETVGYWLKQPGTRGNILYADAEQAGLGWHQDLDGRIWWVFLVGR